MRRMLKNADTVRILWKYIQASSDVNFWRIAEVTIFLLICLEQVDALS